MRRAYLAAVLAIIAVLGFSSCGGGYSGGGSQTAPVSNLKNRAWVSNSFAGRVQIVDASKDTLTNFGATIAAGITSMLLSTDKSTIVIYSGTSLNLTAYDTKTEVATAQVALPGTSESIAITSDGSKAYAAVRSATNSNAPNGAIIIADMKSAKAVSGTIPIADVRWIALSHNGSRLLAFSDQSDTVYIMDPTASTVTPSVVVGTFSRPIAAVFSSDDSKAYILSCGVECGGTQASVTELTIASGATRTVNVSAASVGLLDGSTLYVAGVPPNSNSGTIQAVDTTAMTAAAPKTISGGFHTLMKKGGNNIFIGASNCGPGLGCLSMFNPSDGSVKIDDPPAGQSSKGIVTGMTPITDRTVMYVIEGGELRVYDTATGNDITPLSFDIVGAASDVVSF